MCKKIRYSNDKIISIHLRYSLELYLNSRNQFSLLLTYKIFFEISTENLVRASLEILVTCTKIVRA